MSKKIILIAFEIGVVKGFENVRSAHIQLPYKLAIDLKELGFDVMFLTNPLRKETFLPEELSSIPVTFIPDPRQRKKQNVMHVGFSTKVSLFGLIKAIFAIRKIAKSEGASILHFVNGSLGVGLFAAIIRIVVKDRFVVWTPSFPFVTGNKIFLYLLKKIDSIVCSTKYLSTHLNALGIKSTTIRHGTTRKLKLTERPKFRVTFWRDPSFENGADIALSVFQRLAPEYPEIIFTMLLRPHWESVVNDPQINNIEIYEYPYPEEISLEGVLSETIACFFPFRELSTNPQLCILETVISSIPCFATDIESVSEYVLDDEFLLKENTVELAYQKLNSFLKYRFEKQPLNPSRYAGFNWHDFASDYLNTYLEKDKDG